jgi:hypothetical protein
MKVGSKFNKSGYGPVAGFCEYDNEFSGSIKRGISLSGG